MFKLRSGLGLGLLFAVAASTASAQSSAYVKEAVQAAVTQAAAASLYSGYGAADGGFCLLGGWIKKGEELQYSMVLEAGKGYLFVGAGDSDVGDLDLVVSDGETELEDVEVDSTPWVHLSSEAGCTATITLKNHNGTEAGDFCVLMILEQGGKSGSGAQLVNAAAGLVQATDAINCQTDREGWSLMGGLFATGQEQGIERELSEGAYSIIGWGDSKCLDLDLSITSDEKEICADQDHDTTPIASVTVEDDAACTVTLRMFKATENAFGLCVIVKHPGE